MAATNPFKTSDLVSKYGWQVMVYLANLGVNLLSEAAILFVDSGNTAAGLDADDGEHGHSFQKPLLTLDYAVGLCTANQGDVILVAPGHSETLSGASDLDFDVSGITVIGLGSGSLMPTFSLGGTDAATTVEINGDNITLRNLRFIGADEDGTTVCIDIQTGSDYITLDGLHFFETVATMEILTCITLEDKTDQCTIKNCVFRNLATGSNAAAIITEADEHDFLVIDNCVFFGDWTTAAIDLNAQTIVYPTIKNCSIVNLDATIGACVLVGSGTAALIQDCRVITGKSSAYPIADITLSFTPGCIAAEKNTYDTPKVASGTQADFSS